MTPSKRRESPRGQHSGPNEDRAGRETPTSAPNQGSRSHGQPEALPPLVAGALDASTGSALARLRQIAAHSSSRERYTSLELINDGPGGRVLRVWDEDLQREVALKEIVVGAQGPEMETETSQDESQRIAQDKRLARFIDEARITSQLDHPSIVSVHEIAADDAGRVYYTMPLVRGATLTQVIERLHAGDEAWSLARAINITTTVCEAMAYAHARGVVHQDLKPDNVLVGSFGEAIVTDWGLARVLDPTSIKPNPVGGTLAYMAPEVPECGGSIQGDVYALGAILYAMLSGRTPHEATVISAQGSRELSDILLQSPRGVLELAPETPRELVAVVDRAMATNPEDRYQGAGELAADLRAWLEGRVVHAFESGPLAEIRKWHRRNRGLALALHSLAVLAVLSTTIVWWIQVVKARELFDKSAQVDQRSYAAELRQADLSSRAGLAREAREALSACEPPLRGWAWSHLDLRTDASLLTVRPLAESIPRCLVQGYGNSLILGGSDGELLLLNRSNFEPQGARLDAHTDAITAICTTINNGLILSASLNGGISAWDSQTLEARGNLDLGDLRPKAMVAMENGRVFFLVPEGRLYVLDLTIPTEGPVLAPNEAQLMAAGTSLQGMLTLAGTPTRLIAALGDGRVRSFDPDSPTAAPIDVDMRGDVRAFSALGTNALAVGLFGGEVLLLDPQTLNPLRRSWQLQEQQVRSVAASPDGTSVLVGTTSGALYLLDLVGRGDGNRRTLLGHSKEVIAALMHDNEGRISSISFDGTLRSWSARHSATRTLAFPSMGRSFALAASGNFIAVPDLDGAMHIASADGQGAQITIPALGGFPSTAFLRSGEILAVAANSLGGDSSEVQLFDASNGEWVGRMAQHAGADLILVADEHGERLATHGSDGHARVWDLPTAAQLVDVADLDEASRTLALSPDGLRLAALAEPSVLRIIEVATGAVLVEAEVETPISSLTFSPDGESLWIGSWDGIVHSLTIAKDAEPVFLLSAPGMVRSVASTPDGNRLAISAGTDPAVRIHDSVSGKKVLSLRGHKTVPYALAFDRSGSLLASASEDGTVRLWLARP
ncbi:MAG: WD40 repeat protein [Planctomycetota bacterium]|jgi:WD40 repeat protein